MPVVVREIHGLRPDCRTFILESAATSYYEQTARPSMDEPGDSPGGDPSIVTNYRLCSESTREPIVARELALSEQATRLTVCIPRKGAYNDS